MIDPLTKDELAAEAKAWPDIVKASVQEMADIQIAASKEQDPETEKLLNDKLAGLHDKKSSAIVRFDSVLTAFEKKGGAPDEYRTYLRAVSGINITNGDNSTKISVIRGWLTSRKGGVKWALAVVKVIVILIVFWILSSILALIGGGAFIIGFALQDTLGNFAAGLMLLVNRPFDVGDVVETAGVMGKVDNVSLVSTSIRTPDNKVILVPNKSVWGQVITNATASSERRVDMVFGIGYGDDMAKAQQILEDILARHDKVLETPAPVIKVNELADSSVNFVCRPWSKTADYWDVYWAVTRKVKEEFDAQGISIPFPQQDIHLHQVS